MDEQEKAVEQVTEQAEEQEGKTGKLETPLEIYRKYQRNTNLAEAGEAEILKGLKAGVPVEDLFLVATKIVSMLTDNPNFHQLCERALKGE